MVCPLLVTGEGGNAGTIFVTSVIACRVLSAAEYCSAVVAGKLLFCVAWAKPGAVIVPVLLDAGAINEADEGVNDGFVVPPNVADCDTVLALVL